jgi:hypothetical protein
MAEEQASSTIDRGWETFNFQPTPPALASEPDEDVVLPVSPILQ